MRIPVFIRGKRCEIVNRTSIHAASFRRFTEAHDLLRRLGRDTFKMIALRKMLSRAGAISLHRMSDKDVLEQIAWRLVDGRFALVETPFKRARSREDPGGTLPDDAAPSITSTTGPSITYITSPKKGTDKLPSPHWVEFLVLDDDTGRPVPEVMLKLKLPDGTTCRRTTDANGLVRLTGLTLGACDIVQLHDREACEVVDVE